MRHFFYSFNTLKNQIINALWIVFSVCLILPSACKEKEEPLPEGFNRVAGFELIPFDSIFLMLPGEQELRLSPKFTEAFGDEVTLASLPPMQIFIDGKRMPNPPRIPTDKVRVFEVYAKIGEMTSKPVRIHVVDVNPRTFVSDLKVSMGDSTKSPYAISGQSLVDFKVSIFDYRGREFSSADRPSFKFYLEGVHIENIHRVPILRSGEIPFWAEIGDKKSEIKILTSRELPDFSEKISLPIVFHIVHTGGEVGTYDNPKSERVVNLVNETNEWLSGKANSGFPKSHNHTDLNLEFYLATHDPEGNPMKESGIHRILYEEKTWEYAGEKTSKFLFDQMWNPNEYVNVFITNVTNVGGYAYPPPTISPDEKLTSFYGFVLSKQFLTRFVTVHELGHFLGLPHIFSEGQNCVDGDRLPDTEYYNYQLKQTVGYLKTNCEGEFFYSTNAMDYYPTVSNSFTLDQVSKMRRILERGYFLPVNKKPNERIKPQPWKRGVFDPSVKPID